MRAAGSLLPGGLSTLSHDRRQAAVPIQREGLPLRLPSIGAKWANSFNGRFDDAKRFILGNAIPGLHFLDGLPAPIRRGNRRYMKPLVQVQRFIGSISKTMRINFDDDVILPIGCGSPGNPPFVQRKAAIGTNPAHSFLIEPFVSRWRP